MGTKIVLACADNKANLDLFMETGVCNALGTFYYISKRRDAIDWPYYLAEFKRRNGIFIVDSGAYTFKVAAGVVPGKGSEDTKAGAEIRGENKLKFLEKYLATYISWIKTFGPDPPFCPIELDVDEIVGRETCDGFRAAMEQEGIVPVPVWHGQMGMDDFKDLEVLCEKYKYICISILGRHGELRPDDHVFSKIFTIAKKYRTKLHGLQLTDPKILSRFPYYSCDSSSWLAGPQYGITYELRGRILKIWDKQNKNQRKRFKSHCEKLGLDYKKFLAEDALTTHKWNLSQWIAYNRVSEDYTARDYWNAPADEERDMPEAATIEADTPSAGVPALRQQIEPTPSLWCNTCIQNDRCPYKGDGAACVFNFGGLSDFTQKDVMASAISQVFSIQLERVRRGAHMERGDGGALDKQVSADIKQFMHMMRQLGDVTDRRDSVVIKAKGAGAFERIFGGMKPDAK